jgi:ABC-type branched-subunit amino acid transport system substrate-binding protein
MGSAGATSVPGVTSSSITIGATVPLTGIANGYAEVSAAAAAVFDWQNTHGKVNGRTINYIRVDDCYEVAGLGCGTSSGVSNLTYTDTEALLTRSGGLFATVGSLGTATQDSVRDLLKSAGTPQLFVNSGSSDWNESGTYPGLFGFQASYKVEGKIFAALIAKSYKGQKVGFIGQNDDFGANAYTGITEGPNAVSVASNDKFLYNPADAAVGGGDLISPIKQMQTDNVKVVVLDAVPPVTYAALYLANKDGFHPKWIISSVGSDPKSVNYPKENGATSFDSLPATNDGTNVWNKWLVKVLLADKTDFPNFKSNTPLDGNMQYGASYAVAFLEALKTAGANPTQAGLISAMTSTKFATPAIVPLAYSSSNHQGLLCGVLSTIVSTASTKAITTPSKAVQCTTDVAGAKITTGTYKIQPIPSWL